MKKSIRLNAPVLVNGVNKKEVEYDIDLITGDQFCKADVKAREKASDLGTMEMTYAEFDTCLHYYLGCYAILAVNPDMDLADAERISGPDIMKVYAIGRNFTKGVVEEAEEKEALDLEPKTSDQPSEATAESTTPELES